MTGSERCGKRLGLRASRAPASRWRTGHASAGHVLIMSGLSAHGIASITASAFSGRSRPNISLQ